MFLDLYSKHISHANMVLSHAGSRTSESGSGYGASTWSPNDLEFSRVRRDGRDPRQDVNVANGAGVNLSGTAGGQGAWQKQQESIQHPATPLLDTLSQCQTWARHGGVM